MNIYNLTCESSHFKSALWPVLDFPDVYRFYEFDDLVLLMQVTWVFGPRVPFALIVC